MTVSTHVLDASAGRPAADVAVSLSFAALPGGWVPVESGETDGDGLFGAHVLECRNGG